MVFHGAHNLDPKLGSALSPLDLRGDWSSLGTTVRGERGWYEASRGA